MPSRADEQSRVLGGVVVVAALLAGALFLAGLAARSYWALAIPVAGGFLFVLSLVIWIGWTIATVQSAPEGDPLPPQGAPSSATTPSQDDDSVESRA